MTLDVSQVLNSLGSKALKTSEYNVWAENELNAYWVHFLYSAAKPSTWWDSSLVHPKLLGNFCVHAYLWDGDVRGSDC